MEHLPQNIEAILSRSIPGFHQYRLGPSPRPVYISRNLAELLGCGPEELLSETEDLFVRRVHPADRDAFSAFLREMSRTPQQKTIRLRLLKAGGALIHVSCTMTSREGDLADCVLTDITDLADETQNLRFLNDTMPCGFLKYTCGADPRITYINDRMKSILRIPEGDPEELYRRSIYLMIPPEERRRFSVYLERVSRSGAPIAGEMTVLRWDGTRARLFGWVSRSVDAGGNEEFQSACMDVSLRHQLRREQESARYLKALSEVYDRIFEYDLSARTVKCLSGQSSPVFRWLENIPMQMEEATDKWILGTVAPEDREAVESFFRDFYQGKFESADRPPMIRYRARSSEGVQKSYTALFVKTDESVSLLCCRGVAESEDADSLRSENSSLKGINENMQKLVMRFTDGLAAFEIIDDVVTPLYASDNVCEFFGYSREQWLSVMKQRTPIRTFVARSRAAYEDFKVLLETGEAEFSYFDLNDKRQRRIRAICSQREPGAGPRYVMLYNIDSEAPPPPRVRIRTFGYFDVFVDGRPIAFRNEKSRELFALLVDRRGGFVSSEEAIGYLWEDEPANSVTLARYRKVALRLKNLLEEYGIADIVESVGGKRRIVTEKVQCDLYDYLSGRPEHAQTFKGSYLSNYSWGESTLAELLGEHLI